MTPEEARKKIEAILFQRLPVFDMDVEPNDELPPNITHEEATQVLLTLLHEYALSVVPEEYDLTKSESDKAMLIEGAWNACIEEMLRRIKGL